MTLPYSQMQENLSRLVNGDFAAKSTRLFAEVFPRLIFKRQAKLFTQDVSKNLSGFVEKSAEPSVTLTLPQLGKFSPPLRRLKNNVMALNADLEAFIIQGSLGSEEQINYSDCDALVIIKDEVLLDPKRLGRLAYHLFKARQTTYEIDPLQHHGWFVATQSMMLSWPQHYLPVEAMEQASLLDGDTDRPLSFSPASKPEVSRQNLLSMMNNIEANLDTAIAFDNLYRFKGFVSKILLIPALYTHARYGKGIFKRESFTAIENDFAKDERHIIETCSDIRQAWPKISAAHPKSLSRRPGLLGDIMRRKFSAPVPNSLRARISDDEIQSIKKLHARIKSNLSEGTLHD
jgi:hypothetical protein